MVGVSVADFSDFYCIEAIMSLASEIWLLMDFLLPFWYNHIGFKRKPQNALQSFLGCFLIFISGLVLPILYIFQLYNQNGYITMIQPFWL